MVKGLAYLSEPESYVGGSLAPGRATHRDRSKGSDPLALQVPVPEKAFLLRKHQQKELEQLDVVGFQSHQKILKWLSVAKAGWKPLTGRSKS